MAHKRGVQHLKRIKPLESRRVEQRALLHVPPPAHRERVRTKLQPCAKNALFVWLSPEPILANDLVPSGVS